uniref:6-cysteine protein n=1 Tax=Strongyloides venezuelensis TaxID=75913 RepID=A0A0K0F494_STRVS
MTKLLFFYFITIIHICILLVYSNSIASKIKLRYKFESSNILKRYKENYGVKEEYVKEKFHNQNAKKEVIIFKISIGSHNFTHRDVDKRLLMKFVDNNDSITNDIYDPEESSVRDNSTSSDETIYCTFKYCKIGFLYYKQNSGDQNISKDVGNVNEIFYIGFIKTNEFSNLILKILPTVDNKHIFNIVLCPDKKWIRSTPWPKYIPNTNNTMKFPVSYKNTNNSNYKFLHCHSGNDKTFLSCGRLEQLFMPPIDVGYGCTKLNSKNDNYTNNLEEKEVNLIVTFGYKFICNKKNILDSKYATYGILKPDDNNKLNSSIFTLFDKNIKFYSKQRIIMIPLDELNITNFNITDDLMGYTLTYEPKCTVPNLKATLHLKINDIVQNFEIKTKENSEEVKKYIIDKRKIKNAPVRCQVVPDGLKNPAFDNFYDYYYSTSLVMFDETKNRYKKVSDLQSLVSNAKYKCILNTNNGIPKYGELNFIKESKFTIILIESTTIDMFLFGALITVALLSIVGIFILKKFQPKKKKAHKIKSTSSSSSTSTSPSRSKSSSVISNVHNVPIIQKKAVNIVAKKIAGKNANKKATNNEDSIFILK